METKEFPRVYQDVTVSTSVITLSSNGGSIPIPSFVSQLSSIDKSKIKPPESEGVSHDR